MLFRSLPLISYFDGGNLEVVHCGNAACSSGKTSTTVDSGGVGLYGSETIGADGLPLVSYFDILGNALKVLHCGNAACSSGNTKTTVDSGNVGEYSSVTIGIDGLPLVSYYDQGNGTLKVMHCGTLDCSSGNTFKTVDSSGNVGGYTSVTIGADGLPVVSYRDFTHQALKVLHCDALDCSSGNTSRTVDTNNVGLDTAVTIGADGLPFISYIDVANSTLKVLHCGNAFCVPYLRRR